MSQNRSTAIWNASTGYAVDAFCALAERQHTTCTDVLNDFIARYSTQD